MAPGRQSRAWKPERLGVAQPLPDGLESVGRRCRLANWASPRQPETRGGEVLPATAQGQSVLGPSNARPSDQGRNRAGRNRGEETDRPWVVGDLRQVINIPPPSPSWRFSGPC
ncbi:hypothetical protein NDU88_001024 [Pleurodeles waltl]|uniref:Uncharacterized protein n=1 Tax=Pleurodeles waltl TaxID=8319 RepID=A0AAV7UV17_PLEWA|nr:hypothetical protein NDU88_001024 [Pleurodeles waltl]